MAKKDFKAFSKSSYAVAKLHDTQNLAGNDEPVNGLQKIGKTRFGMYWLACTSLDPCLPTIWTLVINKTIKFRVGQILCIILINF